MADTVKVEVKVRMAGPGGVWAVGEVRDCDRQDAARLVQRGFASYLDQPKRGPGRPRKDAG